MTGESIHLVLMLIILVALFVILKTPKNSEKDGDQINSETD